MGNPAKKLSRYGELIGCIFEKIVPGKVMDFFYGFWTIF
jgi:hypothetical protein